jgi:hypothetical protein
MTALKAEAGKLPAHGVIFGRIDVRGVTRLRPVEDVVIRELQATASYMVDATQQAKLEGQVRSGRNAKRDWNGAMYVARLRGRSVIVVLVFVRDDVGRGRKIGGESEMILYEGCLPVLMVEIAIGDSQRLGRAAAVAVDLVGK